MKEKDKTKKPDLDFEKALADLEGVVEELEKGGLSLNESLARFERGVRLSRFLRNELDNAEKKIEILLKDEAGEVHPEPFSLEEAESGEPPAAKPGPASRKTPPKTGTEDDNSELPF
ncbi:MAG TPA: exodeoxyribonuclease VII small subunit [Candidatus Aminicenantes bacterium]|nr:exodeoxyribonuclease VII small subunit [Candidatus Aminicenantes bacterium]HNT32724.1 exodeoxyribonuclease VII small subunit [Candidatus Aminicenantes bacterium]